jgi:hypothetical protein
VYPGGFSSRALEFSEHILGERRIEVVGDPDFASSTSERALWRSHLVWEQPGNGTTGPGNHNLITVLDAIEQTREMRFGLMNVDCLFRQEKAPVK